MGRHTIEELYQWQALPLNVKVNMSKARIRDWVEAFGEDGVYVSFSGGKDSTVLLNLVRQEYPGVTAVFVDTGLEYPEIREFVKTFENVEWLRPKKTFKQVINDYGYPFISKEVSECVEGARKYLTRVLSEASLDRQTDRQGSISVLCRQAHRERYLHQWQKLTGIGQYMDSSQTSRKITTWGGGSVLRFADLTGIRTVDNRIDARLWQGYRQFADSAPDGDKSDGRQSNSGDYP